MRGKILPVVGMVALAAGTAGAQNVGDLQQGVRIRVHTVAGEAQVGTFGGATPDTLVLTRSGPAVAPMSIAFSGISRVEASQGRPMARRAFFFSLGGAAAGLAVGSLVDALKDTGDALGYGLVCGALAFSGVECLPPENQTRNAGKFTGAVAGVLAGALVGAVTTRERWRTVSQVP